MPPAQRVRLKDGCEVEIRPIEPADAQSLEEGLEALGFESRYRRFLIPKRSFSSKELAYLTNVDHHQHEALVALEPGEGRGLAVARFIKDPDDPRTAEVAIVVADEWQNRGLGRALLERLVERAVEEGVQRFSATVLALNHDIVALLRKVGPVEQLRSDSGVTDLHVELPDGGPRSPVLEEALRAAARGDLALSHRRPDDEELHAE